MKPTERDELELALRVLRLFAGGREPYAPATWPMVEALREPASRAVFIRDIRAIRDKHERDAWRGDTAYRPYEEAADLLADLGDDE